MGFIDDNYARSKNLPSSPLPQPRILRLADGTIAGTVTRYTTIRYRIGPIQEDVALYRWPLDGPDIILGLPWLRRHNPDINWRSGAIEFTRCPPECGQKSVFEPSKTGAVQEDARLEEGDILIQVCLTEEHEELIRTFATKATEAAIRAEKPTITLPDQYKKFSAVFAKESFDSLPE